MKRHLINFLILFIMFFFTTCSIKHAVLEEELFKYTKISAELLERIGDDFLKSVYFAIDDSLYVLTIIDTENDDFTIFNLTVKDKNNPLLYNGPSLYGVRAEFINCDNVINTAALKNGKGFIAEYNIKENTISYEKF